MKATDNKLLDLLTFQNQYVIPIYQRKYSWNEDNCEKLWDDILSVANHPNFPSHFIGSIIYIRGIKEKLVGEVEELLVIDGQQRLITVSLLLAALAKAFEDSDKKTSQQIREYYLFNMLQEGDKRYRLKPTDGDREEYFSLLDEKKKSSSSSKFTENYLFFEKKFCTMELDFLKKIYQGISKLKIVEVTLKHGEDDPQLIFESVNSTGLGLSKADLIRNFILMDLEPEKQKDLYETWSQMEKSFVDSELQEKTDRFIKDYLTIKNNGIIPTMREIYNVFQHHYIDRSMNEDIKDIIDDIYKYSKYYIKLSSSGETDKYINSILTDIRALRVDVAYPFLMEVYDDCCQKRITREEFIEILKFIESYVFRRAICGVPTNSLNKTFATLSKELVKDKEHYLESFKAAIILKESHRRFPDDDEFKRVMMVKDLYHLRSCEYYLTKLEKHHPHKEVNIDECTTEHIMPQTLSVDWKNELGENWEEIYNRYIHTIGNLTLAAYNIEYSNSPFIRKRDLVDENCHKVGLGYSPLRLNEGLADLDHWNEAEILKRAHTLVMLATVVWPYPQLSQEILDKYRVEKSADINRNNDLEDAVSFGED